MTANSRIIKIARKVIHVRNKALMALLHLHFDEVNKNRFYFSVLLCIDKKTKKAVPRLAVRIWKKPFNVSKCYFKIPARCLEFQKWLDAGGKIQDWEKFIQFKGVEFD